MAAGLFPDEVQDEVFATPDVRVCGTLSPSGTAMPASGGFTVNGRWNFISGALELFEVVPVAVGSADGAGVVRAGAAGLPAEHAASASVSAPASTGTARRELRSTSAG